jgi:hypothetical protein
MKSMTTIYYIDNIGLAIKEIENDYLPFIREKILMKDIRKKIFSLSDEKLLREIKQFSRPVEAL